MTPDDPETRTETENISGSRTIPPRRTFSVGKKILFSFVMCAFILGGTEAFLMLLGIQPVLYDEDPHVGFGNIPLYGELTAANGQIEMVTSRNKMRFFNVQRFPREKAPGTYRIFCMGGSTTYGRPYKDSTSFAGWLREFLQVADRSRTFEVINAGGISYASYRVARLMEELNQYKPDLFIVYTGHNEFLERRTYDSIINLPGPVKALESLLTTTRTYSVLRRLVHPRQTQTAQLSEEVNTLLDQSVGLDAYQRDENLTRDIVEHYRFYLLKMVEIARSSGAEIMFVTPACKLRDCSPFKSQSSGTLNDEMRNQCETLRMQAGKALKAGDYQQALSLADQALQIDPRMAHLIYCRAEALYGLGRYDEARVAFRLAADEDICPLRALTAIQAIVAEVARAKNVRLVDFVKLVETRSEHGIPGDNLFLDHVHPTIEGNRILALELLKTMRESGLLKPDAPWGEEEIRRISEQVESRIDRNAHGKALSNLAQVLNWAGKVEESKRLALQAVELMPLSAEANLQAGIVMAKEENFETARDYFQKALQLRPDAFVAFQALDNLGLVFLQRKDFSQAETFFREALKVNPADARPYNHLGLMYRGRGELKSAADQFRQALQLEPGFDYARKNLQEVESELTRH